MNQYRLSIVRVTRRHTFFHLFVNGALTNTDGYICMENGEFDRFFKDLFKSSRGNCVKAYSTNPPCEFYP